MTDYLTVAEVLAIHADQIERYGGSKGVRDHGLLEAALYRPQTGHYADLVEEAAALWESLSQNHPFTDGNKRTALPPHIHFSLLTVRVLRRMPRRSTFLSPPSTMQTSLALTSSSRGFTDM